LQVRGCFEIVQPLIDPAHEALLCMIGEGQYARRWRLV
jgi:hypothetical protein